MSRKTDFSTIEKVARITWNVFNVTPLCIKAGTVSAWEQSKPSDGNSTKTRQVNAGFDFFTKDLKDKAESQVSDFYYDVYLENNTPRIRYKIPAASVRGALRNYTIKRLVSPKKYWDAELRATSDNDAGEQQLPDSDADSDVKENNEFFKMALKTPGWHLIQNLFGIAADTKDKDLEKESVAGRLRVSVGDLKKLEPDEFQKNLISGKFNKGTFKPGSTHGKMVITTRNPLDRVTKAAKKGGLHSFMELAPGNRFTITLEIANPKPGDIGFAAFWEQAVNTGLLRFGGLTSSGRGRLEIKDEGSEILLNARTNKAFPGFEICENPPREDVLAGVFNEYRMTDWKSYRKEYLRELQLKYEKLKNETITIPAH